MERHVGFRPFPLPVRPQLYMEPRDPHARGEKGVQFNLVQMDNRAGKIYFKVMRERRRLQKVRRRGEARAGIVNEPSLINSTP
jgi:hypothetical protein